MSQLSGSDRTATSSRCARTATWLWRTLRSVERCRARRRSRRRGRDQVCSADRRSRPGRRYRLPDHEGNSRDRPRRGEAVVGAYSPTRRSAAAAVRHRAGRRHGRPPAGFGQHAAETSPHGPSRPSAQSSTIRLSGSTGPGDPRPSAPTESCTGSSPDTNPIGPEPKEARSAPRAYGRSAPHCSPVRPRGRRTATRWFTS